MSKIVPVTYARTKHSVTRALYQYDFGQKLQFSEDFHLDGLFETHFANVGEEEGLMEFGNAGEVTIPNECLRNGADIEAWLFVREERTDGESIYRITIPVVKRAKIPNMQDEYPEEYIFDGSDASTTTPPEIIFDGGDATGEGG